MKPFFTIADPELTQDSSVDPMGILSIWTHYGQAVFNQRITTVANDIRTYTFNIFHHHVIQLVFIDKQEELAHARNRFRLWRTDFDVKAGLLILLEDLVTWIFFKADRVEQDVEKMGILGINKARRADENSYYLQAYKSAGLLKNQLNLGMSGRYKGPLMAMGFFDRSFTYHSANWEHANLFFNSWENALLLRKQLMKLISELLLQSSNRDYPRISLAELIDSSSWKKLSGSYLDCFGNRKLPAELRKFWRSQLGLNSGAAKALFAEMPDFIEERYGYRELFRRAIIRLEEDPVEKAKLKDILAVEPFLSHTEYLLRYLAQPSVKTIKDVELELTKLRTAIMETGRFAVESVPPRLRKLQTEMLEARPLYQWIQAVLSFHEDTMRKRGGDSWVLMTEDGHLKHRFGGSLPANLDTVSKYLRSGYWYHTYYLDTLSSISKSL